MEKIGTSSDWNTGGGGLLSLGEEGVQEELGPTRLRRESGRIEEIVMQIEGGGGETEIPLPMQTHHLQVELGREEGGGGRVRNVKRLVRRFGGEQSRITSYFGRGEVGGGTLENSGMERGGSVGSKSKKSRWKLLLQTRISPGDYF